MAKFAFLWREWRNGLRLDARRVVSPETLKTPLHSRNVIVPQVSEVAGAIVGKPLIYIVDRDLMEQSQREARGLPLIVQNSRQDLFLDRRLKKFSDLKRARVHVPLN